MTLSQNQSVSIFGANLNLFLLSFSLRLNEDEVQDVFQNQCLNAKSNPNDIPDAHWCSVVRLHIPAKLVVQRSGRIRARIERANRSWPLYVTNEPSFLWFSIPYWTPSSQSPVICLFSASTNQVLTPTSFSPSFLQVTPRPKATATQSHPSSSVRQRRWPTETSLQQHQPPPPPESSTNRRSNGFRSPMPITSTRDVTTTIRTAPTALAARTCSSRTAPTPPR